MDVGKLKTIIETLRYAAHYAVVDARQRFEPKAVRDGKVALAAVSVVVVLGVFGWSMRYHIEPYTQADSALVEWTQNAISDNLATRETEKRLTAAGVSDGFILELITRAPMRTAAAVFLAACLMAGVFLALGWYVVRGLGSLMVAGFIQISAIPAAAKSLFIGVWLAVRFVRMFRHGRARAVVEALAAFPGDSPLAGN